MYTSIYAYIEIRTRLGSNDAYIDGMASRSTREGKFRYFRICRPVCRQGCPCSLGSLVGINAQQQTFVPPQSRGRILLNGRLRSAEFLHSENGIWILRTGKHAQGVAQSFCCFLFQKYMYFSVALTPGVDCLQYQHRRKKSSIVCFVHCHIKWNHSGSQ